jgi:DNA (cytosine-5)-methyltransferase 1
MRNCIQWEIPTQSIFGRKKPHAEATQRRLAAGLVKYVLEPYQKAQMDLLAPLEPHDDLQLDFLTKFYGTSTGATLDQPCPTVTASGQHLGLVQAWIAKHYSGVVGHGLDRPLGTITTKDHHSLCDVATGSGDVERVVSWLTKYYGSATHGSSIDKPCPTITTKARMGLAQAIVNVRTMQIVDVRMRMCTPRELARAMGFPDSFILTGTETEQVARIGNAVPPHLAAAVVAANENHHEWRAAA